MPQDFTRNIELFHFHLICERINLLMITLSMIFKSFVDLIPFKLIPIRERVNY